jgi:hypothetical protein
MLKYADQIAQYGGKITSISNQNDFVNILFTAVAGSERLYTDSPFINTWTPPWSSFARWHSPATMFSNDGDHVILDLSDAKGSPGLSMSGLDDFTDFAQAYMSKDDFAYLCYFAMSQIMGNDADKYGDPVEMPEGFQKRFLSLVKNYLDVKGVDPQDVLIKFPELGELAGLIVGNPGAGAAAGAAVAVPLAIVLAVTPSMGYNTVPRDFGEEVKRRLLDLVTEVEQEPWWDVTKWDVWYRIDHDIFGGVDFPADETQRSTYYRKMIDMNDTSAQDIERIWTDVASDDQTFAATVRGWTEKARACLTHIQAIAEKIPA